MKRLSWIFFILAFVQCATPGLQRENISSPGSATDLEIEILKKSALDSRLDNGAPPQTLSEYRVDVSISNRANSGRIVDFRLFGLSPFARINGDLVRFSQVPQEINPCCGLIGLLEFWGRRIIGQSERDLQRVAISPGDSVSRSLTFQYYTGIEPENIFYRDVETQTEIIKNIK